MYPGRTNVPQRVPSSRSSCSTFPFRRFLLISTYVRTLHPFHPFTHIKNCCLDSAIDRHHDACMRTTVTLDPDVERLLKDTARKTGKSFKQILNCAVREGLAGETKMCSGESFSVNARRMGLRPGIDPAGLNRLADEIDVDDSLEQLGSQR